MKRALVSLLVLASCKPLEVPQGRYACDPNGNREVGSAQCPGASRCGLEGYCHATDEAAKWKCIDASDCEKSWQCGIGTDGVSRECHDPNAPEDHRCLSNDDCSGGWTCGLDVARLRRCHDPMMPKAWPCEATSDCVGGWQCGIAATGGRECHDPAKPEAWACLSNDDCLGGWQCGINDRRTGGECHDPAKPRAFACERDSDCLGGWSCGLNDARTARECHDPNMPRAFACERATDCLAGWQCGLNDTRNGGECHDPNMPREFACRDDADCVASWDCGLAANRLQRECHDPQNPRAFACENDADCLGGWRCDVDGRCVNPVADALEPAPARDGGTVVLAPLDVTPISNVSVSPEFNRTRTIAMLRLGRLEAATQAQDGRVQFWTTSTPLPGPLLAQGGAWVRDISSFPGQELARTPMVYSVLADGGVTSVELLPDGGVTFSRVVDTVDGTPPVSHLRHGVAPPDAGRSDGSDAPLMLGFSPGRTSDYLVWDGPGRGTRRTFTTVINAPAIDRPNNRILDLANYYLPGTSSSTLSGECTFVVDAAGLWLEPGGEYRFQPLHTPVFGNALCGPSTLRVERFTVHASRRATVVAQPWDGGLTQVAVWDLDAMLPRQNQPLPNIYCESPTSTPCSTPPPFTTVLGPCTACPAGVLRDTRLVEVPGLAPELETRCESPDGGLSAFYRLQRAVSANGCVTQSFIGTSTLFLNELGSADQPTPHGLALRGPRGQVWVGESTLAARSLGFDETPRGVLRLGPSPGALVFVGTTMVGTPDPVIGLSGSSRPTPTAIAQNEPTWALWGQQLVNHQRSSSLDQRFAVAIAAQPLPAPVHVLRATLRGTTLAIISSQSSLATAIVNEANPIPGVLTPRVSTVGDITSLSFTERDGGVLEGYVSTSLRVAAVTATTPTSWSITDVPLPAALTPREVWFTRGRGRVGFDDGSVFSLPSRVRIAPPLLEPVRDFESACGRQFALTDTGLFELEVTATSLGAWRAVPLPATVSSPRTLLSELDRLYVFTELGDLVQLPLGPCSP